MSRCGCAEGSCPCNFEAGPGILITGNGRRGNPFKIARNDDDPGTLVPIFNGLPTLHHPMFAADKGGVVDDSSAVGQWLAAVVAGEASGYAPEGKYLLGSAAQAATLNAAQIMLKGDGEGVTEFIVPASNTTGGILLDGTGAPRSSRIHFSDFSVVTRGVGVGTGVRYVMTPGGANHHRNVTMRNVEVRGDNGTTNVFQTGVDFSGCWRPLLSNVVINGPFGPGIDDNQADSSPLYVGAEALKLDDAYAWLVRDSYFWSYATGISDVGTNAEGGRLLNSHMVGVLTGLDRFRTSPQPGLELEGCHINYRDQGAHLNGAKVSWIKGCHIYNVDDTEQFTGNPIDIHLENAEEIEVLHNFHKYPGHGDRTHIWVDGSTLARRIKIKDNVWSATGQYAALISTLAEDVTVEDNDPTGGTYTKVIQDNSGAAIIRDSDGVSARVESQSSGALANPVHKMMRDSASPAANDLIGRYSLAGRDSTGVETEYAALQAQILTATDGSEASALRVFTQLAGALTELAKLTPPANGETAQWTLVNRGGVYTLERQSYGAVDSGGSGKRAVTIPN